MTTITDTTGVSAASSTSNASAKLAGNFDTFLKLLTAQLRNQDPLSPVDSSQFTQQLVQYSQVEQQIQTNSQLAALSDQIKSSAGSSTLSYIGHLGTFASDMADLADGAATWDYSLPTAAASVKLTVLDANGKAIYSTTGEADAGAHAFIWNGKNSFGVDMAPGQYKLQIVAQDGAGKAVTPTISVNAVIKGVDMTSATPSLLTAGGDRTFSTLTKIGAAS